MRKDFSKKQHSYKPLREYVRKNKLKNEIYKKRLKYIFLAFLLIAILICAIYWLFFSGFFDIKEVKIRDYANINANDLPINANELLIKETTEKIKKIAGESFKEKKWRFLPAQNIFLLDNERVAWQIKEKIPTIYLNIQKSYLKRLLIINLQARQGTINLISRQLNTPVKIDNSLAPEIETDVLKQNQDTEPKSTDGKEYYYLIDNEGYITEIKNNNQEILSKAITIIYIHNEELKLKKMDKILTENIISKIIFLNQKISSLLTLAELNISNFTINKNLPDEVRLQTKENVELLFSFKTNTVKQLNYLKLMIENELKNSLKNLRYIDLRTEDKIFYQ